MISLTDTSLDRRSFLRVGGPGLAALPLAGLPLARAAEELRLATGKSVVFLFMHGGPSQYETFDPHMDAPDRIRSATGEIRTRVPGLTFGGTFPRLADLADRFTVVRSFTTAGGNHDIKPIVSKASLGANVGALMGRTAGALDQRSGMPRNVVLFPQAVAPDTQEGNNKFGKFASTGTLGRAYAPFVPGAGGDLFEDLRLHISTQRLDDRRHLLSRFDRFRREAEASPDLRGMDEARQQAFGALVRGIGGAFDLSREDPRVRARYDTSGLVSPDRVRTVWNNHNNYKDHVRSLGHLMLLARRLCEAGCGFVTVTTNFVWDMHADKNNATMVEGMDYVGRPFDHAVATFIEDLEERGLRDRIMLVCCGEMGRTPKINAKGGRDHWGRLAPLMLYGTGVPRGAVIGRSDRQGGEPDSEPVTMDNLVATILHTLVDVPALRLSANLPGDLMRLVTNGKPIPGLE